MSGRIISRAVLISLAVMAAPFAPLGMRAHSQGGAVVTPQSSYSDPAWASIAGKYSSNLSRLQRDIASNYRPDQIHFLTTSESGVGGVGFWASPFTIADPNRFLGVFARVRCPEPCTGRPFPDTQTGRIMTIMDAFGKHSISVLARELEAMPDPKIKGAVMIFIHARLPVTDPTFEQNAEVLAIFMPREAVIRFAQLRMTVQTLVSQSEMLPVFTGPEEIGNLRMYIIQP